MIKDLYCTGATQRSLTNEGLSRIQVLRPTQEVVNQFGCIVQPIIDEILILQHHNQVLHHTRDLLLPKLIFGEIDVSELDIDMDIGEEPA